MRQRERRGERGGEREREREDRQRERIQRKREKRTRGREGARREREREKEGRERRVTREKKKRYVDIEKKGGVCIYDSCRKCFGLGVCKTCPFETSFGNLSASFGALGDRPFSNNDQATEATKA